MSRTASIGQMAEAITEELTKYRDLAADKTKKAVRRAGKTVREDIQANAPERTGAYAKSWKTKVTAEDSQGLDLVVYSPSRYRIAHLLEYGHARRNGGRVRAIPHIAPAEERGAGQLLADIEKELRGS